MSRTTGCACGGPCDHDGSLAEACREQQRLHDLDPDVFPPPPAAVPDVEKLLADLEAMHAAATPGPWEHDPTGLFASNNTGDLLFDHKEVLLVDPENPEGIAQCTADGELIVAAVNEVPHLVAAVRAGLALAEQLEDVAKDYRHAAAGSHDAGARNAHTAIARRLRAALSAPLAGQPTTDEETGRG